MGRVFIKSEGERPLGNFKVLGGMVAGLRALARAKGAATLRELLGNGSNEGPLQRLICASDGNHGLAVAAAARRARTHASIFLPIGVNEARAERIRAIGGEIVWIEGTYDDAVFAAAAAAAEGDGLLVADTSADPSDPVVHNVLDGYALLSEIVLQFAEYGLVGPSHVFVQAGVGGLAADPHVLCIVEPQSATCVAHARQHDRPERISGDLSTCAEMLSCSLASAPALAILCKFQPKSVIVTEYELKAAPADLIKAGRPRTTPSGAAGVAGLLQVARTGAPVQLDQRSVVLTIATEAALD